MRMRTEEKRRVILDAGEQLFGTRRYDEITMEEVARQAGVGKGTLYRYFSGKEALLSAVLQACHDDLVASLRQACGRESEFRPLLREVCAELSRSQERRHPMFHLLFTQQRRGEGQSGRCAAFQRNCEEIREVMTALMERGVSEGVLRDDMSPGKLAWLFLSLVRAWSHSRLHAVPGLELTMDDVLELFGKGAMK